MRSPAIRRAQNVAVFVVLAALSLGAAVFGAYRLSLASGDKNPDINPDAGLSDEQRHARYADGRSEFQRRHAEWLRSLDIAGLVFAKLPRAELFGITSPPLTDFAASARAADLIVAGRVVEFVPGLGTSEIVFEVEATIAGEPAKSVRVLQPGGLAPTPDWRGVIITDAPGAPTLVPGDAVPLVLQRSTVRSGLFEAQPFTGIYRIDAGGRLEALPGNPVGATLAGLDVTAATQHLNAAR